MTARRGLGPAMWIFAGVMSLAVVSTVVFIVGRLIDKQRAGLVSGPWASARIDTTEVSPGDDLAVSVWADGELYRVRARVGAGSLEDVWVSAGQAAPRAFVVHVPADAPLGTLPITIEARLKYRVVTDQFLNTVYYHNVDRTDAVPLEVTLRSADERSARARLVWARAFGALAVILALAYAAMRWPWRTLSAKVRRKRKTEADELGVLWGMGVALACGALGDIVFVHPIQRVVVLDGWLPRFAVGGAWAGAVLLGVWRGFAARERARPVQLWEPARLRAVVGTPREVGYREAASTLPPMLSREAPRCTAASIADALRAIGCDVTASRGELEVGVDGEAILRIRADREERWAPEALALSVRADIDGAPLVLGLSTLFGPLEYRAFERAPVILQQTT